MSNSSFFKDGGGSSTTTASIQNQVDAAVAAKEAAQTAKTAAELAETNAESAETNASGSASAAAGSATAAAGSATTATNKAAEAAASESAASDFATAAAGSATSASNTLSNTVTLTTSQTISGAKVFSANADFGAGIDVTGTVTADGLTVDGSTTLNTGATANGVLIDGTGGGTGLKIRTSETATLASPDLTFTRTGNRIVGGATNIGQMHFDAKNSNSGNSTFAEILGRAEDYTENDEDGSLLFRPSVAGTLTTILNVDKNGIDVTGTVTADEVALADNKVAGFGTSEDRGNNWNGVAQGNHFDLEIFHQGSASYIKDYGTGNLAIEAADLSLRDNSNNRRVLCTDGASGSVALYYGNSSSGSKLDTSATGVTVTGTVTADGLTLGDNEAATFNGNLEIKSNGTDSTITETGDGSLTIKGQNFVVKNASNQNLIVGASSLQLYGAGERRMQTVSAGIAVEGTSSLGGQLTLREADYDNAGEHKLTFKPASDNWAGNYDITVPVTGDASMVVADSSGNVNVDGTVTADGLNVVTPDGTDATINVGADYLHVICDDLESGLLVRSDSTDAGSTPDLYLRRTGNAATGEANLGVILFQALNNASPRENTTYANIVGQQISTTDGDEDGKVLHRVVKDGTITTILEVEKTGIDVTGTTTSDRFTGSQTHNIQSGAETMSGHVGQKTINYGASGTVVYTFPDVADGDKGDTWTVVNASDHDITCNRTSTSVFDKLSAGSDAVSANTVTIAKGGVAEFVVTAANVITVFGSGIS